jgi:hypothetical protein
MSKHEQFKQTQLYDWGAEPVDERPSEFMPSTGHASLSSGYRTAVGPAARRANRSSRFGLVSLLLFVLAVIGLGGWAIVTLASMFHH